MGWNPHNPHQPGGLQTPTKVGSAGSAWKESHRNRYGSNAINPQVDEKIKEAMRGIATLNFSDLVKATEMSHYQLKQCAGVEEGVCPAYATGLCKLSSCKARHLFGLETPPGWVADFCKAIGPGVGQIWSGETIPSRKRAFPNK